MQGVPRSPRGTIMISGRAGIIIVGNRWCDWRWVDRRVFARVGVGRGERYAR